MTRRQLSPRSMRTRNVNLPLLPLLPPLLPPSNEGRPKRKASQDFSHDGGKKPRYDSSSFPMTHFTRSDHLAS